MPRLLPLLWLAYLVCGLNALGISVPPIKAGDSRKYSSKDHLDHCVAYPTVSNDIIMVSINAGDKLPSQSLNLNVFDDDGNKLRFQRDISRDITFMFTNLNSPTRVNEDTTRDKRTNFFNFRHNNHNSDKSSLASEESVELINSNQGKSMIYICFDNLYADKSWSFQPRDRDIELFVDVKTMKSLTETNYNNYAQFFNRKHAEKSTESSSDDKVTTTKTAEFTEEDFESKIAAIKMELDNVVDSLHGSEHILSNLMDQEYALRDVNEQIFEEYTRVSIILLITIALFGLAQIVYFKYFLKKRRLL